jgi:hypothetical protein
MHVLLIALASFAMLISPAVVAAGSGCAHEGNA